VSSEEQTGKHYGDGGSSSMVRHHFLDGTAIEDRQRLTLELRIADGADAFARAIAPLVADAMVRQLTEVPSLLSAEPRLLLTVEQVAERPALGRTTVYSLIKSGDLTSVKIGQIRRIPADALDDFVRGLQRSADEPRA
jgi:excisionase family DNA binding protein